MIVIGVDPGARHTGIVVVDTARRACLDHHTLSRPSTDPMLPVSTQYANDIVSMIGTLTRDPDREIRAIAVETVTRPNWHVTSREGGGRAAANPEALIAAAVIVGAVITLRIGVPIVQVPPGHNGSAPLAAYPDALVSDRERAQRGWRLRVGTGTLRHARSAFDVALHAPTLLRSRP